jgi:hypothetical protein
MKLGQVRRATYIVCVLRAVQSGAFTQTLCGLTVI